MADVLGIHGKDANPHLWYDVPQLDRIATAIAGAFARADPPHAPAYRSGLHALRALARAAAARGRRDPHALPRRAGRVHRAGAGLPRRGGRAAQPRAGLVHAADRGGNRAVRLRRRGHERRSWRSTASGCSSTTARPSPPSRRGCARPRTERGHPRRAGDRDPAAAADLPAVAARPGPRARRPRSRR